MKYIMTVTYTTEAEIEANTIEEAIEAADDVIDRRILDLVDDCLEWESITIEDEDENDLGTWGLGDR